MLKSGFKSNSWFYLNLILVLMIFCLIINGERTNRRTTSSSTTTTSTTSSTNHDSFLDSWYNKNDDDDNDDNRNKNESRDSNNNRSNNPKHKHQSNNRTTSRTSTTTSTTTRRPSTTTIKTTVTTTEQYQNLTSTTLMPPKKIRKIEVVAFCNDPGRPPKSQISPVQLTYMDGEEVVYTCDQFISLKQYRKCVKGKWQGEMPICGEAFRDNDLQQVLIYKAENGFPTRLLSEYNLTGQLQPFNKFGNSFIAERFHQPVRAGNSTDYYWNLVLAKPALIQLVRLSFSVVNHLTDSRLRSNVFDVVTVATNQYRECKRIANHSVSPWHYNSTRFDYWYICRAKSEQDFFKEIASMTNVVRVETSSEVTIKYDLATFILAEQYSNNNNLSDPICGLPEIPVGMETRVINDQANYVFTCAKDFQRIDDFGGQFQVMQCGYDNRWHGSLPQCHPIRSCQKFNLENDEEHTYLVEVFKYDRVYYINETEWIPIRGSRAFFRCKDETNIFVGKEIRICDDGEWTNSLPNCLPTNNVKADADSFRTGSILLIVITTLLFTFLLSSCTIYFFLKLRNQQQPNHNGGIILPGMELSDSASGYYSSPGKQIDEVYEVVDPHQHHTRYAAYQDNIIMDSKQLYDFPMGSNQTPQQQLQQHKQLIQQQNQIDNCYYDDSDVRPYLSMHLRH